jgi:hypothetical protein
VIVVVVFSNVVAFTVGCCWAEAAVAPRNRKKNPPSGDCILIGASLNLKNTIPSEERMIFKPAF